MSKFMCHPIHAFSPIDSLRVKRYTQQMQGIPTGPEIQAAREAAGLTTTEFAQLAGLADRSHLRKIERGGGALVDTLRKIVAALEAVA